MHSLDAGNIQKQRKLGLIMSNSIMANTGHVRPQAELYFQNATVEFVHLLIYDSVWAKSVVPVKPAFFLK